MKIIESLILNQKMQEFFPAFYFYFLDLSFFFLPDFMSASFNRNSICPFTLRNSSFAQDSRSLYISSSILSTKLFLDDVF